MAGYRGYSKSNNALEAERENKFPASVVAKKLKVSAGSIKALLQPCEWHHTSSHYNQTDYYDIDSLLKIHNSIPFEENDDDKEYWTKIYQELRDYKEEKSESKQYRADVEFLTWSGSRRYPVAKKHTYTDIVVQEKGCWYTFKTGDGDIRKKINSNGTVVCSGPSPSASTSNNAQK